MVDKQYRNIVVNIINSSTFPFYGNSPIGYHYLRQISSYIMYLISFCFSLMLSSRLTHTYKHTHGRKVIKVIISRQQLWYEDTWKTSKQSEKCAFAFNGETEGG